MDTRWIEVPEFMDRYHVEPLANKRNSMYYLKDTKTRRVALMKNGDPFEYSTERLAELGAKWLGRKRKTKFSIHENRLYTI